MEYNNKDYLDKVKDFYEKEEPVRRGCPNINTSCFCPGTCQEIIGYRNKETGVIKYIDKSINKLNG
jgi:hypothetical protein